MSKDVAIPGDRNVIKKEAENILKYKDLIMEIQSMWNVKAKVIPVKIGATGTYSKSLRQYLSNVAGKDEIKELQKHILNEGFTMRLKINKYYTNLRQHNLFIL